MKAGFFREPRNSTFDWIPVGFGVLLIVFSVAGPRVENARGTLFGVDPEFVLLGVAFVLMGGAELLPAARHRLAVVLRFVTVGAFLVWLATRLLT
jgi:hypothetical protein